MIDNGDALGRYKKMLDESRSALEEPRTLSQRDRDYYDGKQLTTKQRNTLKRRKQPETIRNRIGPAIDGLPLPARLTGINSVGGVRVGPPYVGRMTFA